MKAFRGVVLAEEGKTFVEISKNLNAIPYILDGEVTLNENFSYKGETLLHFRNDGSGFSFKTLEPALTKRFQGSRFQSSIRSLSVVEVPDGTLEPGTLEP